MADGSSSERRYQRASCAFSAEFTWGTVTHPAQVMIIGLGGCFLATPAVVPAGEEVDVAITVEPEERPLHCRGKVAWLAERGLPIWGTRYPGFALEFLRIFPEDRGRIDEYVRKQTRIFRAIEHELKKRKPDLKLVKDLFRQVRPEESAHLSHIRRVCREELKHFRLRK